MNQSTDSQERKRWGLRALRILDEIGGRDSRVVLLTVIVVLIISVIGESVYALIQEFSARILGVSAAPVRTNIFIFGLSVAAVILLTFVLHRRIDAMVENDLAPIVREQESKPVRVLVLFYSLPALRNGDCKSSLQAAQRCIARKRLRLKACDRLRARKGLPPGMISDKHWLAEFKQDNWRMPMTSIAYHMNGDAARLDTVVLIGSPTVQKPDQKIAWGSTVFMPAFIEEVKQRLDPTKSLSKTLRIVPVGDLIDSSALGAGFAFDEDRRKGYCAEQGVFFEDLDTIMRLLFRLYGKLKKDGYAEEDILVDITGGKALSSIAGAAFAVLVRGRRFQYIDTNTYAVKSYDVHHDLDDVHAVGRRTGG